MTSSPSMYSPSRPVKRPSCISNFALIWKSMFTKFSSRLAFKPHSMQILSIKKLHCKSEGLFCCHIWNFTCKYSLALTRLLGSKNTSLHTFVQVDKCTLLYNQNTIVSNKITNWSWFVIPIWKRYYNFKRSSLFLSDSPLGVTKYPCGPICCGSHLFDNQSCWLCSYKIR